MKYALLLTLFVMYNINLFAQTNAVIAFGDSTLQASSDRGLIDAAGNHVMIGRAFLQNVENPIVSLFNANYAHQWAFALNETGLVGSKVVQVSNSEYVTSFSTGVSSILFKFNSQGNIIWYKKTSDSHSIEGLVADSYGNVYAAGNKSADMTLYKFSITGVLIWAKKFNMGSNYFFGRGLELTDDGNLLLVGSGTYVNTTSTKNKIGILKLSLDGDIVWQNTLSCSSISMVANGVAKSNSKDRYLIAGYAANMSNISTSDALSVLIDSGGNYINNTKLSYLYWDQFYDVIPALESGFILSGLCKPHETCGGNGIIVRMSNNNDTLKTKTYGEQAGVGVLFFDLHPRPQGYAAFGAGSHFGYWNGGYEMECVKFDNSLELGCGDYNQALSQSSLTITEVRTGIISGNIIPTFTTTYTKTNVNMKSADVCNNVVLSNTKFEEINFSLYPNPASEQITIQPSGDTKITSMKLFNLAGQQCVHEMPNSSSKQVLLTRYLPRGIYIIELKDERGNISRKKLVLE